MGIKCDVLKALEEHRGAYISGERLASSLHVSRQAVCKAVRALCDDGYEIASSTRRGYKLEDGCDVISAAVIADRTGAKVFAYDSVPSTNAVAAAKYHAAGECLVVSLAQTAGRKKDGGDFYSPRDKGIYLSAALDADLPADRLQDVRRAAAEAVRQVIARSCGKEAEIRNVDEIFIGGKKACGILVECCLNAATLRTSCLVIGVGVYTFETCFEDASLTSVFPSETRNRMIADIYSLLKRSIKAPHG